MKSIGTMVGTLARAQGIPIGTLAEAVQIHRNRLADKIAGRREFTEDEIRRLAEHFGIPPGRLFDDPLELLGISTPRRTSFERSPSAESGLSPRRSGCTPTGFAEAA